MRGFLCLSGVRLGLLAVLAAVGLALVAGAQAAPPDPVTLGLTTLSNIRLNGVTGTQLAVAPGANVTITADWSDTANNSACPFCIDNLPVAFQGFGAQPAGCIENNSGFGNRSGTGTVSLGAAPTTPGIYNIVGNFEQTFFCGQFWTVPNAYPVIAQVIVGCTQIVSGTISAPLQIGAGVTCIIGGTIAGSVSISAGAVLIATGATISGPLRGQGAAQIVVCDSSIAGPVSVSGSTGSVRIGSATAGGSPPCGGNVIMGSVTLTGNAGGAELGTNTIAGQVILTANGGPAAVVAANTIAGPLSCTANSADPTDNGQPNTVNGPASGQCAALG